jgi:hypothetical protein
MTALTSVALVLATLATSLGLGAMATSLTPSLPALEERAQDHPAVGTAYGDVSAVGLYGMSPDPVQLLVMPLDLDGEPASTPLPPASAAGPWISPLYPQNSVTLWDRIRVSSSRDRRAYLLGTAIQVHGSKNASMPGPQYDLSHPHGAD